MPLAEKASRALLARLLALAAKAAPGADAKVAIRDVLRSNLRFARNRVTSNGVAERRTLYLELALGKRRAGASTNQIDDASLGGLAERTAAMARLAPEDPEVMPPVGPQTYRPLPGAWDAPAGALSPAQLGQLGARAIATAKGTTLQLAGYLECRASSHALASSAGLFAHHEWTMAEVTTTARTADATGSGWAGAASNRLADLELVAVARVAADKAVRSARPRPFPPGRTTVILEPAAVAYLLNYLVMSLAARSADEGRSFFARRGGGNRIGESVFGPHITLRSDPTDVDLGTWPYDNEGLPLAPTTWIDRGRVLGLPYSRYWAARQGKLPTGDPFGFQLVGGTASREDLLKGVKRGVLITRFWYTNMLDPRTLLVTGLTRDGTFLVEDGAIVGPVHNFRFNESVANALNHADAMTASNVGPEGGTRVPALRTHDFNLASVSEAV